MGHATEDVQAKTSTELILHIAECKKEPPPMNFEAFSRSILKIPLTHRSHLIFKSETNHYYKKCSIQKICKIVLRFNTYMWCLVYVRLCVKHCMYVKSFNSHNSSIIIPLL